MSRIRTYKTEAVVLKQTPLGEADRILSLYTPDLGKVRAIAKGVRRSKSKLGGHLELLNHVSISLSQGRNLDVVNEAEVVGSFRDLREKLLRLCMGLYAAELVDGFSIERSPNYAVYQLLLNTLRWLGKAEQPNLLLRHTELHLLDFSGYRPELDHCIDCRITLKPGDHFFTCAGGGVLCPRCQIGSSDFTIAIPLNCMKLLRFLQREQRYSKIDGLKVSSDLLKGTERMLMSYVRYMMERELKSIEFLRLVSSNTL